MQLMDMNLTGIASFNPKENVERGTTLLSRLLDQYGSIELALAAYNAEEENVRKYGGIPPFKEIQTYIKMYGPLRYCNYNLQITELVCANVFGVHTGEH